ncbi:hypothetical protein [Lysobacter panacisoli]|uniref:Uncharacterized protein n=1 Tax=Lysobacter panacisoli TaxID=1255263 RepID=A0ABP9LPA2_9GAMM|nr:hypothetical protein [Lysobacter panacisoli]
MSTVLWANVLRDGVVRSEEQDRGALYKHADKLDAIAKKLGLPSFLSICDSTDARYNVDEDLELPEGMESTNEVMAVSGAWLARTDALSLLEGLLTHIRAEKTRFGLLSNQHDAVVEELDGVLGFLRGESGAEKFNFAIVM